jgi:DNA-binding NarL/FixJ family response regulator
LLASGVYAASTNAGRRAAHRRLAAVVEGAEERARHLALASVDADPDVIAALDAAADEARRRGAPADSAELLSLALGLGAAEPSRLVAAAESHFAAGDLAQAQALAERAVGALEAGPERARALGLLGTIRHRDDSYEEATELLEQARAEAGAGASRVTLALILAYVLAACGRLREAPPHAAAAVAEAERLGEPGLLAEALAVRTMVGFLLGQGFDEPALERALELEDPGRPTLIVLTPRLIATYVWGSTGSFEQALRALDVCRRRCLEHGAEVELIYVTASTVAIPCEAGELERARELVEEASERALQLGTPAARAIALGNEATLAGWTGDADRARRCARESLALFESIGVTGQAFMTVHALGRLELSLGAYEAAAGLLVPPLGGPVTRGDGEPAAPPFAPDAIEALLALGRLEDARPLVRWLSERAEALGRPQLEALAARGRGLLLAAEGDLERAEQALVEALAAHERQPIPYDRARTLLARGQIQRRRRTRRAARASLEEARQSFQQLGAARWAALCESELGRLGLRRSARDVLTPSERRVAELAARGLTNREVAATLFVSPKTVEANLSRAYRKLSVHSRAELGRRMAENHSAADPG